MGVGARDMSSAEMIEADHMSSQSIMATNATSSATLLRPALG